MAEVGPVFSYFLFLRIAFLRFSSVFFFVFVFAGCEYGYPVSNCVFPRWGLFLRQGQHQEPVVLSLAPGHKPASRFQVFSLPVQAGSVPCAVFLGLSELPCPFCLSAIMSGSTSLPLMPSHPVIDVYRVVRWQSGWGTSRSPVTDSWYYLQAASVEA